MLKPISFNLTNLALGLFVLGHITTASGLTVINNDLTMKDGLKVEVYCLDGDLEQYRDQKESCWKKVEGNRPFFYVLNLPYGEEFKTDALYPGTCKEDRICLSAGGRKENYAAQQWTPTNPIHNDSACVITFNDILTGGAGNATATAACDYCGQPEVDAGKCKPQ